MAVKKKPARLKAGKPNARRTVGGPYLAAAVFCQSVMEDKAGGFTPVRIIDGMNITVGDAAPPDMPSKDNALVVHLNGLIVLRSGDSPGKHFLNLAFENPNGDLETGEDKEVVLSSELNGGIHIPLQLGLTVTMSGVYWVHVKLDARLMTKMPIQINVAKADPVAAIVPDKPKRKSRSTAGK